VATDYFKRIDTTKLYGPFLAKAQQLAANCEAAGALYIATSGLRTFAEQDALFAQGRTSQGPIVTNARAGESPHNSGIGVDFVRDIDMKTPGVQPSWKLDDYEALAREAEKVGLEAGAHWARFKDPPHIQLPVGKVGLTWAKLKAAHDQSEAAVKALLDAQKW
jgi:peptidoglycan L-alanyl-D-glutamate endopeptidase CwlK